MLRAIVSVFLIGLFTCSVAAWQVSGLPPVYEPEESAFESFLPLAPQLSPYYGEANEWLIDMINQLGMGDIEPYELPAPVRPWRTSFGLDGSGFLGSGIALDRFIWEGMYPCTPPNCPPQGSVLPYFRDFPGVSPTEDRVWAAIRRHVILSTPPQPVLAPTYTGDPFDWIDLFGPYLSRAYWDEAGWKEMVHPNDTASFGRFGFPRVAAPPHIDIPPTYPPTSLDVEESTSPLVPSGGRGPKRAQYLDRQTVAGRLDMLTGQPLLTEVDLELPFGGAVFRRLRTYSERPGIGMPTDVSGMGTFSSKTWLRGWHGMNWMSSDAPIFLIDASLPGTVAAPDEPWSPACFFIPDAHHAIPFLRQERLDGPPDYVAPAWFDAMLLYDKSSVEWDTANRKWIVPPAEFRVYMYGRSVIYTIRAYYEDVDPKHHQPPAFADVDDADNVQYGVPYYGLVQSIEDRAGNRIDIAYAPTELHKPQLHTLDLPDGIDGPGSSTDPHGMSAWAWAPGSTSSVAPIQRMRNYVLRAWQRGWYKGMIDRITLTAAGDESPSWTLLYTYRHFFNRVNPDESVDYWSAMGNAPALHSILVYDHLRDGGASPEDVSVSGRRLILPCDNGGFAGEELSVDHQSEAPFFTEVLTLGNSIKVGLQHKGDRPTPFDYQDEVIGPVGEGVGTGALPAWDQMVRFTYADPPTYLPTDNQLHNNKRLWESDWSLLSCGPVTTRASAAVGSWLLKAAAYTRLESGEVLPPRYWLYRYQDVEGPGADLPDATEYNSLAGGPDVWQFGYSEGVYLPRRMTHRYGPRRIDHILAYRNASGSETVCDPNRFVNFLITLDEHETFDSWSCDEPALPGEPRPSLNPGTASPDGGVGGTGIGHVGLGNQPGRGVSSTASNSATTTGSLPIGLLADTIYYRWSEPYQISPRITGDEDNAMALPASWEALDGRWDMRTEQSETYRRMVQRFVGGEISDACGDLSDRITQFALDRSGFLPEGVGLYAVTDEAGTAKWYRIHRFITTPATNPDGSSWRGNDRGTLPSEIHGPEVIWDSGYTSPTGDLGPATATRAIYMYPFRFFSHKWNVDYTNFATQKLALAEPMWWVAIDEYDSLEAALGTTSSLCYEPSSVPSGSGEPVYAERYGSDGFGWRSRRVVAMNSAGAPLSDRTWTIDSGEGATTDDPPAVLEAYVYDEFLRLEVKLSRGWGAAVVADGVNEAAEGLVEVFEYDPPVYGQDANGDPVLVQLPRTVVYHKIRRGCLETGNDHQPIKRTTTHTGDPDHWWNGLTDYETFYDLGVEPSAPELGRIDHYYDFWPKATDADPEADAVMKFRIRLGPKFRMRPDGIELRPVASEWYNAQGQLVWRAKGAISEAGLANVDSGQILVNAGGSTEDQFLLDYYRYDEYGRPVLTVEDIRINPDGSGSLGFDESDLVHPEHPHGANAVEHMSITDRRGTLFIGKVIVDEEEVLADADLTMAQLNEVLAGIASDRASLLGAGAHRASEADALNLVTFNAYNRFGPCKTVHPDGRRDLTFYKVESDYFRELRAMGVSLEAERWRFAGQNLYDSSFEGQAFVAGIQGTIDELEAGAWDGAPYNMDDDLFIQNRLRVTAHIEPQYDTAGRLTGVSIADAPQSPDPLVSAVSYDGWGNVLFSMTPDMLITRHTYDGLGRLHKTFVGSRDRHFIWGVADENDEDDDLFLTEKLFYGTSPSDAGLPVRKWAFRTKSPDQYNELTDWAEPSEGDLTNVYQGGCSGCGETSSGRLELYGYDWRMRRVITRYEDLDEPEKPIREERTFLDNMDRVRFVAVYGASPDGPGWMTAPPSAPDPTALGVGQPLPAAADFLDDTTNLLSLDETVYNEAGQVVERRRYDVNGTGGFLVTHSYADFEGRPLWSSSSGGQFTYNVYDAKGRLVKTREMVTLAGGVERVLSETINFYAPDETVTMVRTDVYDATTSSSTPVYAKVEYHWYDSAKRRIATMDLGRVDNLALIEPNGALARPVEPPLVFEEGSGEDEPSRRLIGCSYPTDPAWFDASGRGLARLTASWYGPLGKQNASLTVTDATLDAVSQTVTVAYTLRTTEYNNFAQPVLELEDALAVTSADWSAPVSEAGAAGFLRGRAMRYKGTQVEEVAAVLPGHTFVEGTNGPFEWDETEQDAITWRQANWDAAPDSPPTLLRTRLIYGAPIIEPGQQVEAYDPSSGGSGGVIPNPVELKLDFYRDQGVSIRPDLVFAAILPDPVTGLANPNQGDPDTLAIYFYYPDGNVAARIGADGVIAHQHYDADGNLTAILGDDADLPVVNLAGMPSSELPDNTLRYTYDAIGRLIGVSSGRETQSGYLERSSSALSYDGLGNLLAESQWRDGDTTARTVSYGWETLLRAAEDPVSYDNNVNRLKSITYPARVGTHDAGAWTRRRLLLDYGTAGSLDDGLSRVAMLTSDGGPAGAELGHVATYAYDPEGRLAAQSLGTVPGVPGDPFTQTESRVFDRFGRVSAREVRAYHATEPGNEYTILASDFTHDLAGRRLAERLTQLDHTTPGDRDDAFSGRFTYDGLGRLMAEVYGDLDDADPTGPLAAWKREIAYTLDALNRRTGDGTDAGWIERVDSNGDGVADAATEISHEIDARGRLTGIETDAVAEPVTHDAVGRSTELAGRTIYYDWLGRPVLVTKTATGDPVVAWRYDGFGRLSKRVAPWHQAAIGGSREEYYYYDGVRRIQEVFYDPTGAVPPWPQALGGGGGSNPQWRTEAEFVWSAASGVAIDTLHTQIDWWDREAWFVQDHATGTVRAYTDPSGEVAEQYGFDAFGRLVRRDEFRLVRSGSQGYYRTFRQRVGHHGLIAERLDHHTNARTLDVGADLWMQSRSRWYAPDLGRFITPDPNGTGAPVMSTLAMLGTVPTGPPSGAFEWDAHLGDGFDVFGGYGGDPVNGTDPTGLFFGGLLDTLGATATSMHMRATQNGVYAKMLWGGTINGAWGGFWGGINAGVNDQSVTAGIFSGALTGFANGALTVGVAGMGAQGVKLLAAVFSVGGITAAVDAAVMGEPPRGIAKAGLIGGIGNSVGVGVGKADSSALLDPRNQDAVESVIDILWPALEGWAKTLADTWGFW